MGGVRSAVYATETSVEEYLTYTTEETEKLEVTQMTEKLGGNMEQANLKYQKLVESYPDTEAANEAKETLKARNRLPASEDGDGGEDNGGDGGSDSGGSDGDEGGEDTE